MKRVLIALALLLGAGGCDDDGEAQADADAAQPDAGVDMAPPFNYIPLNDRACIIADQTAGVQRGVDDALTDLIRGGVSGIGVGLELCDEEPTNRCPACSDDEHRLNALFKAFNGAFLEYRAGINDVDRALDSIQAYFAEALRYPLRHLTVTVTACDGLPPGSCPADASHRLVLSQSKKQPCADGFVTCDHYSIEPESFDETCAGPPLTLYGTDVARPEGGRRLAVELPPEAREMVAFGFVVPVLQELPPDPAGLTDAELAAWLEDLARLERRIDVRVESPRVVIDYGATPTDGCARLSGWVAARTFTELVEDEEPAFAALFTETLLPQYVDPERPDYIAGTISFEMAPGTFTSGVPCNPDPCGEDTVACVDDVLRHTIEQTRCTLERGPDFSDGDRLAPTCAVTGTADWDVDCAALGSACADARCTVDWRVPAVGELVVSELYFGNADEAAPNQHEWVELTNVSDAPLRIDGCYVRTRDAGLLSQTRTIRAPGPVVVPPGGYYVFAHGLDPALNGGVQADYALGEDVRLTGAGTDSFTLACGYAEIDHVAWVDAALARDAAVQLDPGRLDGATNDAVDGEGWCAATAEFGADGRRGTPGAANTPCP